MLYTKCSLTDIRLKLNVIDLYGYKKFYAFVKGHWGLKQVYQGVCLTKRYDDIYTVVDAGRWNTLHNLMVMTEHYSFKFLKAIGDVT